MYSLWLMPDEEAYMRLGKLIADLSTTHNTPTFEPHVTLLSGIVDDKKTAQAKTRQLAQQIKPIRASLTRIEYLEYYYRCLFFRTDDSEDIFVARQQAEELFEHSGIQPFIPHVSFLYGAMPVFQKKAIMSKLGDNFFMDFRMIKLRLVATQRTPENWELLEEMNL